MFQNQNYFFGQVKANLYQHDGRKETVDEENESTSWVKQGGGIRSADRRR